MPTIKRALGYSITATILTGIIFFSLFTSIVAIPWHTSSFKMESDGKVVEESTSTFDPSYAVNVKNSSFAPIVLLPEQELSEDSDVTYFALEDLREFSDDNETGVLDVSRNTRLLVLGSFVMSLLSTIFIGLVARGSVGKGVGTAVASLTLVLLLITTFYYPVMTAKETSDSSDGETSFGTELKNFYFNSSAEEFEGVKISATQMVGLGWIFMFIATILTGVATTTTHRYFVIGNNLGKAKKKERETTHPNLGSINPKELDSGGGGILAQGPPSSQQLSQGPPSLQARGPQTAYQASYQGAQSPQQYFANPGTQQMASQHPQASSPPSPMQPPQGGLPPYGQHNTSTPPQTAGNQSYPTPSQPVMPHFADGQQPHNDGYKQLYPQQVTAQTHSQYVNQHMPAQQDSQSQQNQSQQKRAPFQR